MDKKARKRKNSNISQNTIEEESFKIPDTKIKRCIVTKKKLMALK